MPVEQPRLTSYMSANGMQCVERAAWHAEYDPVWGVPQRVELVAGTLMPWERPQIWLQILGKAHVPDCPLQQTVMRIEIVDFTPLP